MTMRPEQRIPSSLARALREQRVIPFVGAGVSRAVCRLSGEPLFPNWPELLERAALRVEDNVDSAAASLIRGPLSKSPPNFYRAAELARRQLKEDWYAFLREELDQDLKLASEDSLELARLVWRLGSPLVITTNSDRVLQWVCPEATRLRIWIIQQVHSQVDALKKGIQEPTVWHLHGHIGDPFSLIFTLNDYKRLYPQHGSIRNRYRAALQVLQSLLITHTFLFIGFSLDDAYFALELRELNEMFQGVTGPHYVLTRSSERARIEKLGLPVHVLTVEDFGSPLLNYLYELEKIVSEGHTLRSPDGVQAQDTAPRAPFSVPYRPKGKKVIGRKPILKRIRDALIQGEGPYGPAVSLQGIGGLGKTQLAVEYAFLYRDRYPNGVFWINAAESIDEQLIALADEAKWAWARDPQPIRLARSRHQLRTTSDCLIIFDNVEDIRKIENVLPNYDARSHVLLTSRTEQVGVRPISLPMLNLKESLQVLFDEAGRKPATPTERRAAEAIARRFGGVPLALELAGVYLRHRRVSWERYFELLQYNLAHAMPESLGSFTRHDADLFSTLCIGKELFAKEPLLEEALDVLTWSATAPMSVGLLAALTSVGRTEELESALHLGCTFHLLRELPHARSYAIHPLVAEVRRRQRSLSERPEWVRDVCQRMASWFGERRYDIERSGDGWDLVSHLAAWQRHAEDHDPPADARLSWLLAYPELYRGEFKTAESRLHTALRKARRHCPDDLSLHASIIDLESRVAQYLDRGETAIERGREALSIRKRVLGTYHRDTALSYSHLTSYHRAMGNHSQALWCAMRGLVIRRRLGRRADIAISLTSIAAVYRSLKKPEIALRWAMESIQILERELGTDHQDTALAYMNVGQILSAVGKTEEGWAYIQRALEIRRVSYGPVHPETALSLHQAGEFLRALGRGPEAKAYLRRALYARRKLLGPAHCHTLRTAFVLATVFHESGHTRRALLLLEAFERRLPPDNRDHLLLVQKRAEIEAANQPA